MGAFRARNSGESMADYLKAKQAFEISTTGTSTVNFGNSSSGSEDQEAETPRTYYFYDNDGNQYQYTGLRANANYYAQSMGFRSELPPINQSLANYLGSLGMANDYKSVAKVAKIFGITGYNGSSTQQDQLLNTLKSKSGNEISKTLSGSGVVISADQPKDNTTGTNNSSSSGVLNEIFAGAENASVTKMGDNVFSSTIPTLVPGTQEYQDAMDSISTAYFDVMQQQLTATTESDQIAAQHNWDVLKSYIEKNLNTTLANNAIDAWDQIQNLKGQYGGQGIAGSGLQAESIDNYLKKVRSTNESTRYEAKTKEEEQQQNYYTKFATPAQVKAFIESNPEKAQQYGLVPSDNIRNAMSYSTLKSKYPNMTDEEINSYIATVLDENGNYRSELYQKYMTGSSAGVQTGNITNTVIDEQTGLPKSITVNPADSGMLDIASAAKYYKTLNAPLNNAIQRKLESDAQDITDPSNPNYTTFSDTTRSDEPDSGNVQDTGSGLTQEQIDAAKKAADQINQPDSSGSGSQGAGSQTTGSQNSGAGSVVTPKKDTGSGSTGSGNTGSGNTGSQDTVSQESNDQDTTLGDLPFKLDKYGNITKVLSGAALIEDMSNQLKIDSSGKIAQPSTTKTSSGSSTAYPLTNASNWITSAANKPSTTAPVASTPSYTSYIVQSGDTLSKLAAKWGTTVAALKALNNISNVNLITKGQVIKH